MDSKAIIHKTREDYNLIARHFSYTRNLWEELKPFEKFIKKDGQNILDWGCGNGRLLALFADRKIKYFGVDQSAELLKMAEQKWAGEIASGKAEFFCSATEEKKFDQGFFDMAFLIASFHHLPDEETRLALLKKIYGELKPNGKIIITVWNLESDWAKNKLQKDYEKIGENDFLVPWKNNQGEIIVKRYYHHFLSAELVALLEKSGFKNIAISYDNDTVFTGKTGRNLVAIAEK